MLIISVCSVVIFGCWLIVRLLMLDIKRLIKCLLLMGVSLCDIDVMMIDDMVWWLID